MNIFDPSFMNEKSAQREKRLAARRAYYAANKDRINSRRKERKEEIRIEAERRQKELADKLQMTLDLFDDEV